MEGRGMERVAQRFAERQRQAAERADVIRAAIEGVAVPRPPVDASSEPQRDEEKAMSAVGSRG
jgi:hypothetical protein